MTTITQNSDGSINLTAPVMIPEARDCDYENGEPPLTKQQIRNFAESYEKYQFVDHEHGLTKNGRKIGHPIHSFLLTEDTTMDTLEGSKTYPSGTWFITSQITDKEAIQTALKGGYTGYSASVFNRNRADQYLEALKSDKNLALPSACKSLNSAGTGLIKDVVDPVVLSVSLVKKPCLHDSKLCDIMDGEIMTEDVKSMKSKILAAMGMTEEAEVEALKGQVVSLETKIDSLKEEFDAALKSMQESFEATLKEALTPVDPVAEKSEEVEEPEETDEEETEEPVTETEESEEESEPEEKEKEDEEVNAEKGESKAEPVHDNITAQKSKPQNIYEALGRNPDGTRKK